MKEGGDEGDPAARSFQCSLLRPHPSPVVLLSVDFHRGLRPAGPKQSPVSFCSLSSLSPDSCRLLTSSTWRQWRERGTGADWCLPICQWRFLPLRPLPFSFFLFSQPRFPPLPPETKLCIQKAVRPLLAFSSNTHRQPECGERPTIYRWVDMRTRRDAQT